MTEQLASQHDLFLGFLTGAFEFENELSHEELLEYGRTMNISESDTETILSIFVADRLLSRRVISTKTDETKIYTHNPEMAKMIYDEGGYKKKQSDKTKLDQNTNFTLARNWVWLVGLLISVAINIYFFVITYL